MVNLTRHAPRATPSVTKLVCATLCSGLIVLCIFSRPTEFQVALFDSVWRENGLYVLGIVGLVISSISLLICTFTDLQKRFIRLKQLDIVVHFIGCVAFLFCGAAMLYSTLIILTQIGNCCGLHFEDPEKENATCVIPGFLEGMRDILCPGGPFRNKIVQELPVPRSRFDNFYTFAERSSLTAQGNVTVEQCAWQMCIDSWSCTTCVNEAVQPRFALKGAAGALGILISIFYGVVGIISIGEIKRAKNEALQRQRFGRT